MEDRECKLVGRVDDEPAGGLAELAPGIELDEVSRVNGGGWMVDGFANGGAFSPLGESNGYDALTAVGVKLSWKVADPDERGTLEAVDEARDEGKSCEVRRGTLLVP